MATCPHCGKDYGGRKDNRGNMRCNGCWGVLVPAIAPAPKSEAPAEPQTEAPKPKGKTK